MEDISRQHYADQGNPIHLEKYRAIYDNILIIDIYYGNIPTLILLTFLSQKWDLILLLFRLDFHSKI